METITDKITNYIIVNHLNDEETIDLLSDIYNWCGDRISELETKLEEI